MTKVLSILGLLFFIVACNNEDSTPISEDKKQIKILAIDNTIDSLFYDQEKLIRIKESVLGNDFVNYNYAYNEKGLLSKISTTSSIISNYTEYEYNNDRSLKSRKYSQSEFGGGTRIATQSFSYEGGKISIQDDDANKKTHKKIITLDDKKRIKSIEKQKETLDSYFIYCEYTYDSKGNVSTAKIKNTESAATTTFIFEYDSKNNPLKSLDFDLPDGLSIKKLEAVINDLNIAFSGPDYATAYDYLNFQNTNNVIKSTRNDFSQFFNYQYNDQNYPVEIKYQYLAVNYTLKIKY